ncbi:hypothetical protein BDP55DRAFT_631343 [Colletotrichum godetiae]|uniref:RING-type domain-containing protein n=1 Tax=Colletotrichum godetiae TaxID=1209918 RepID=A0AAJ0AMV8_9PEZI|nr:uncharacterized protein BDP55DRAFT_631343 [Colletotrichum godetiae]KAK1676175.1 hypothetical protein BDP55DRAFT_631343 [Colletotrichum godetiae]
MAMPTYNSTGIRRWMDGMSGIIEDTNSSDREFPISPETDHTQMASSRTASIVDHATSRDESLASEPREMLALTTSSTCTKRSSQSKDGTENGSSKRRRCSNIASPTLMQSPWESATGCHMYHRNNMNHRPKKVETIISAYWPDIRDDYARSLQDPSIRCSIPCSICHENCADENASWHSGWELPVILACGHMIGEKCLKSWFRSRAKNDEPKDCPMCRRVLQCSECKGAFMFSILCHDSYVPNLKTKTYSEKQPMEQTICNDCQAETDFGSRILQGEHLAEPFPRGGASQHMLDWFRQVRDEFETKVKLRLGDGMRPIDVSGAIHKEIFAEMESWLYFLKQDVTHRVQGRIAKIETELDETHWWNRAGVVNEEEEYGITPGYCSRWQDGDVHYDEGYEISNGRWHGDEDHTEDGGYDAGNYTW